MEAFSDIGHWLQQVWSVLSTITWIDFIDVLVVAYIVYKAFQFIRETRSEQLIKGIVLIVVAYMVARLLQMYAFFSILEYIVRNGIIAVVILFQPEIRRAIEQVGQSSFKRSFGGMFGLKQDKFFRMEETIDSVCKASTSMSGKKVGALIVFEQNTNLGDIVKTGVVLDALPSVEVIENIFYPKSPLHDGAMIIRSGKIYASACILPLTKKRPVDRELGTRHRAALGMSEDSDAVVVVVSEETGTISVAIKGVLYRELQIDSLKELLVSELIGAEEERDSIRNTLKKWALKIKGSKK